GNSRQTNGVQIVRGDDLGPVEAETWHHVAHVGQERIRLDDAGNPEPGRTDAALVPSVISQVFSTPNVGLLRARQSLARSPQQTALPLGADRVELRRGDLKAGDQACPDQSRLQSRLGETPVSRLLRGQDEVLVGSADETDARLAHVAERAQEAARLKAIQGN